MDMNLGVVEKNDQFRNMAIMQDLERFAIFTESPLRTGAATGAFTSSRRRDALSKKGRRVTAPLSPGYIDDADAVVYHNNPRSSADSIETIKLFEGLPDKDKLSYEKARLHRPELQRAFPQKEFPSVQDIGAFISANFYGLNLMDPSVPSIQEFAQNSRFSRTEENNTLEYNTKVLNEHIDKFRANDYRILSHDYLSTDRWGYLPTTKVFSTSTGKLEVDDYVCTRRTQVNGESHFIVKYAGNKAIPGSREVEFAYAKLSNRLSLYLSENRVRVENLSVSYNLDPRNIRSMYLRDIDLVFHDYGNMSVTVLVNPKNLAKYFDDNGFTGQYSHVYLEELIEAKALYGVWVSKSGSHATTIDVVNDRKYDLIDADVENSKNMWHVAHIDNAKSHLCKISSLASMSAFSGKALVARIQIEMGLVKYGTVIKAIHDNEASGRLDAWLESPLLARLYDTHDDDLFKEMQRNLGKLHMPNVLVNGKKVPMLVASHDFLDIERENELALLFSTYFLMLEHRSRKEAKSKKDREIVASCADGIAKNDRKSLVKAFTYTHFPIALNQVCAEAMLSESKKGARYCVGKDQPIRSFREYRDDFVAFRPELASRVEITPMPDGRTHVWIKGNSFNNNYNEEYVVWADESGKPAWEKRQSSYELGEGPNVRYALNPALMTMLNGDRSMKTLILRGKQQVFDYFGEDILDKKNWF